MQVIHLAKGYKLKPRSAFKCVRNLCNKPIHWINSHSQKYFYKHKHNALGALQTSDLFKFLLKSARKVIDQRTDHLWKAFHRASSLWDVITLTVIVSYFPKRCGQRRAQNAKMKVKLRIWSQTKNLLTVPQILLLNCRVIFRSIKIPMR